MAMFTCCYTQLPQKAKGYFNWERELGGGKGEITAGEGDKSHKKETEIKFH